MDLIVQASMGNSWLGRPFNYEAYDSPMLASFLLTAESGRAEAWYRLCALSHVKPENVMVATTSDRGSRLSSRDMSTPEWEDVLMEIHASSRWPKIVVVDSLTSMSRGVDENDNAIADGVNIARRVARRTGMTIVIIAHARKSSEGKAIEGIGGNRAIAGASDVAYMFTADDDGTTRTIRQIRNQMGSSRHRLGLTELVMREQLNPTGRESAISLSLGEPVVIERKGKR
jgi:hypothetical protein